MNDVIGGLMMVLGGGLLAKGSLGQLLPPRSAIDRGRQIFGDSDGGVNRHVPPDWRGLLDRLD